MAHSLELRVPLVDVPLWRLVAALRQKGVRLAKPDIARAVPSIPGAIREREKTGFATPLGDWIARRVGLDERGLRGWAKYLVRELEVGSVTAS